LSDCELGEYEKWYQRSGRYGERGKGRCEHSTSSAAGLSGGDDLSLTAWEEEEGDYCLRKEQTWPREEGKIEGKLRVVKVK